MKGGKEKFTCPICHYSGPFADKDLPSGVVQHSLCPQCGSYERHRLQYLIMQKLVSDHDLGKMSLLHFAPEAQMQSYLRGLFKDYASADLQQKNVDYQVNLLNLPFDDGSYDCVIACHVLEHIKDDCQALKEIRRVLRPGGLAILPVPIICDTTTEYPEPNPYEEWHVRAPGVDYYERYKEYFSRVEIYDSSSFASEYQLYIYEDRSVIHSNHSPHRPTMPGAKHRDYVPLCWV